MHLPEIRNEFERITLTWAHVMWQRQAGYPEYLRSLGDSAESQGDAVLARACRDLAGRLTSYNRRRAEGKPDEH